ncbi:MAG TPA: ROK family protein [Steroidobacteraceae bacterium]|nr:ROK family protein [Steroidobacteraceae bacterium]
MGTGALIGAIEGGGTKFVCAVAESPARVLDRSVIPTRDPAATLAACAEFFRAAAHRHGDLAAIGISCFGPLQLRRDAHDYGCLLDTPKEGWTGASVLAPLRARFPVPIALDTDVGAAALGELDFGAGRGKGSLAYVTVGTGIGGALAPVPAGARLMHAEMGHLIVRRDPRDADFRGICPFHGDCLEGLACGPAIQARWGTDLSRLPPGHPGRSIIAGYLAQLAVAIALLHSPELIVMGGGVMGDAALLPQVRDATRELLSGYLPPLRNAFDVERFIQPPALAGDSAIAGCIQMALDTLARKETAA